MLPLLILDGHECCPQSFCRLLPTIVERSQAVQVPQDEGTLLKILATADWVPRDEQTSLFEGEQLTPAAAHLGQSTRQYHTTRMLCLHVYDGRE